MNSIFGEQIISDNKNKCMKLVFKSNSEKARFATMVADASSVSNSRALMDLVKDAIVEGDEVDTVEEVKKDSGPIQESMDSLIARAQEMGIRVGKEDSRAGILQSIAEKEKKNAETVKNDEVVKDEEVSDKDETVKEDSNVKDPEGEKEKSFKMFRVLNESGIQLKGSDLTIGFGEEYEADSESTETKLLIEAGAIEEVEY